MKLLQKWHTSHQSDVSTELRVHFLILEKEEQEEKNDAKYFTIVTCVHVLQPIVLFAYLLVTSFSLNMHFSVKFIFSASSSHSIYQAEFKKYEWVITWFAMSTLKKYTWVPQTTTTTTTVRVPKTGRFGFFSHSVSLLNQSLEKVNGPTTLYTTFTILFTVENLCTLFLTKYSCVITPALT